MQDIIHSIIFMHQSKASFCSLSFLGEDIVGTMHVGESGGKNQYDCQ